MPLHIENLGIFNNASIVASNNSNLFVGDRVKSGYTYTFAWNVTGALTGILKLRGANSIPQGFVAGVIADIQPTAAECVALPTGVTLANGGIQLTAVAVAGAVIVRSAQPLPNYYRFDWTFSSGGGAPNTMWLDMQAHGLI